MRQLTAASQTTLPSTTRERAEVSRLQCRDRWTREGPKASLHPRVVVSFVQVAQQQNVSLADSAKAAQQTKPPRKSPQSVCFSVHERRLRLKKLPSSGLGERGDAEIGLGCGELRSWLPRMPLFAVAIVSFGRAYSKMGLFV